MNIFKFWKLNKGKLTLIILLSSVVILGTGKMVFGQEGHTAEQVGEISITPAEETGKQVGVLLSVATTIAAKILTWVAALINFSLKIGNDVINLPIVQIGSRVVLNFANLGFVLAIIVIAFATIFRVQSYAMKQTLWKLIVAALLVNFSLVIAGAFISVSNIFTDFFLSKVTDADLATGLIGILNPQKLSEVAQVGDPSLASLAWSGFSYFLKYIASLFFVLVFTFLIILTFFAIFIMLLIRAIVLGMLLIVMPLVWLAWIFPGTVSHWQKWWTEFLRWNFFAPAMLFFIYLVVATGKSLENIKAANLDNKKIAEAFGSNLTLNPGFFEHTTQLVITTGLLIGGLFVANKLGITFASTAYGWAQSAGKGVGIWAGRKTHERTTGRLLGSDWMKKQTEKLASSKIPGARWLGTGLNRLGARSEKFLQGPYEKLAKELTPERLNYEIRSSRGAKRAGLLSGAAKRKDINIDELASILNDPKEMDKIAGDFSRSGLNFKDFEKAIGRSLEMVKAKTGKAFREATDKFVQSLPLKDYAKGQWKDIFKKTEDEQSKRLQESLGASFAQYEHGAYAKITPQITGENLKNFGEMMKKGIEVGAKEAKGIKDLEENVSKAADRLEKTLSRRAMFGEEAWIPPATT